MRFAVDTGGTFTDLLVETDDHALATFKASTTPANPITGVMDALGLAATGLGLSLGGLLGRGDMFIHGTTHGLNAILTDTAARTAFLTTAGHPDILLFREGGRTGPFDWTREYQAPYVPRALTFEVPERCSAEGKIVKPLDEEGVIAICRQLREAKIEAVGVCLLWSVGNPVHERRVGELLDEHLPGIPYTLSHRLNPVIREYRRASSTCIDASLKPILAHYLGELRSRLATEGFEGRVLVVSSAGGVMAVDVAAAAPIRLLGSGPAMAPIAGRHYAELDGDAANAIVADTGGTSYDVSLVRRGRIPWTRETWIGPQFEGHITGFASVDVRSIGAGGGSIAWLDDGGLLRVGPESAGAVPGPACYSRGGLRPTVTDACVALGYIDPDYFLGGAMRLDGAAAARSIDREIGSSLGLPTHDAAAAILEIATEHMIHAIEDITVNQGLDPASAVLIGGGAAAGLNAVAVARRLGCPRVIIPETGAVLSAAGALMSDLTSEHAAAFFTTSTEFDFAGFARTLSELEQACAAFLADWADEPTVSTTEFAVEARYQHQMWQIEVALDGPIVTDADVDRLQHAFDEAHEDLFAVADPGCPIEIVGVNGRASCTLRNAHLGATVGGSPNPTAVTSRRAREVFFQTTGLVSADVLQFDALEMGAVVEGPVLIEAPFTTIVIDPGACVTRTASGSLVITP
jgi:N-methylhydantoinase A